MLNLLTQMPEAKPYDLSSSRSGLWRISNGARTCASDEEASAERETLQCYGLSETGFLTGLQDQEHVEGKLLSCGRPCPGIDLRVEDETGKRSASWAARGIGRAGRQRHAGLLERSARHGSRISKRNVSHGDIGYQDSDGYFYILDRLKT